MSVLLKLQKSQKVPKSYFLCYFFAYVWPILGSGAFICPIEGRVLLDPSRNTDKSFAQRNCPNRKPKPLEPFHEGTTLNDGPTTTTTIFGVHLAGPHFFIFGVPPDAAPNAPSTHWNTEKTQRFFICCAINCRFDVASDAQLFWKIVVVFGPSLIHVIKTNGTGAT